MACLQGVNLVFVIVSTITVSFVAIQIYQLFEGLPIKKSVVFIIVFAVLSIFPCGVSLFFWITNHSSINWQGFLIIILIYCISFSCITIPLSLWVDKINKCEENTRKYSQQLLEIPIEDENYNNKVKALKKTFIEPYNKMELKLLIDELQFAHDKWEVERMKHYCLKCKKEYDKKEDENNER